jgi:DNA polymerase III subunit epsilon
MKEKVVGERETFVAVDVETTGLVPGVDRIVELAAVAFQGDAVLGTFSQLVDPGMPMPSAAGCVNGITDEMLRGMPNAAEALPAFLSFVSCGGIAVAHNAVFDVGFICTELQVAGLTPPDGPVLDTRGLARHALPRRQSYSLRNLIRDLDLSTECAHRALADAEACRQLFLRCVELLCREEPLSVADLVRLSGAPLDFCCHAPRGARTAAALNTALRSGGSLQIVYKSARGELSERRIQPLSFCTPGGSVAVEAFCALRNEKRTFRLDSIIEVHPDA